MNIEEIIRAWKTDEEVLRPHLPESPLGRELSEQELLEVFGGSCSITCGAASHSNDCATTCAITCYGATADQHTVVLQG